MFRSTDLNSYTDLIGRLENSRARNSIENMLNRNFNREYRPGLVPGSMRRGPNVQNIGFATGRPAIGYDKPGGGQREGSMDGLRDSALVKARKEHQARLNAHSSKVHKLAKDF